MYIYLKKRKVVKKKYLYIKYKIKQDFYEKYHKTKWEYAGMVYKAEHMAKLNQENTYCTFLYSCHTCAKLYNFETTQIDYWCVYFYKNCLL